MGAKNELENEIIKKERESLHDEYDKSWLLILRVFTRISLCLFLHDHRIF